jgi:drug/metabolite transporter (DMT)-like permease
MKMNKTVLAVAAVAEAGTGVILLGYPPIVVRLLFGSEISGAGVIMSRIAGIALIALGVACWPGNSAFQPLNGMLTYSPLAMLYLICIGVRGEAVGVLLWPAVAAHAILVALLVLARFKNKTSAV